MAAHASHWGYKSNICYKMPRGKWHIMLMKIVGEVVLVIDRILVVFLHCKSYGAGVFVPTQTLITVNLE
jgi:hypothetical protein